MKRPTLTALAVASVTTMSLTGACVTAAQASSPAATTVAASTSILSPIDADVAAARQEFNDYAATLDLDSETRAAVTAAGASDEALLAAVEQTRADVEAALADAGIDEHEWTAGAIDPADHVCSTTDFRDWAQVQVSQIDPSSWQWLQNGFLGLSPNVLIQYWALMKTPTAPHETVLGLDGADTNELARTFTNLQGFWDVETSNISLVSLDGKILAPEGAADRQFVYDGLGKVSVLAAIFLQLGVESGLARGVLEGFPGGVDNPMFSLNAFAIDPENAGDSQEMAKTLGITRRVAMGQGLLQALDELGLGRAGGRAVLAHEFGHQVQFSRHLFETDITDEAEATRRTELMADAFGTYFTVHKQGESLNKAYTLQDQQAFYNVGDCGFASPGHHGTPNQRYRSAEWAVDLVKSADDQGHIMGSMTLADEFEDVLPQLVAPDAQ